MGEQFTFFYGGVFSQWFLRDYELDNMVFNCCEQGMMWHKAMLFGHRELATRIMKAKHPSSQKALGRQVKNANGEDWTTTDIQLWNTASKPIVYRNNIAKFSQHRDLFRLLMDTRGTLVEASPTDRIWGIGLSANDPRALVREQWLGLNWLGEVETTVRDDFGRVRDHLFALDPRNATPPPPHVVV